MLFLQVHLEETVKFSSDYGQILTVSFMPINELSIKLYDQHSSKCDKSTHNVLSHPAHPLKADLLKSRSYAFK